MDVLIATAAGLFTVRPNGDAVLVVDGGVRHVVAADEGAVALLDDGTLRSIDDDGAAEFEDLAHVEPRCILLDDDDVWVGTAGAHLWRLRAEQEQRITAFDEVGGRDSWYTPWGAPPDIRSLDIDDDGALYVGVHVGGVVRSITGGETWTPTMDVDWDVHQVATVPEHAQTVIAACGTGFAITTDRGDNWQLSTEGLESSYARAVAIAGDIVLLSASDGPDGENSRLYWRKVDGERFVACRAGLPDTFIGNVDTHCIAAWDEFVVVGTGDGAVYVSADAGISWRQRAGALPAIRAVAIP